MTLEEKLRIWSSKPSDSEDDRIARTERMMKAAIAESDDYRLRGAKIFAKGSVKIRTNISKSSDIDLCVQASDVFYAKYPEDTDRSTFGNSSSGYTFAQFRKAVESAMIDYFGDDVDITGNKAIRVKGTVSGSRIDADIVPAFEHRRYKGDGNWKAGIELLTKDTSKSVINWPHHNYDNSVDKHASTYRRYKKMVRILKHTRDAIKETGVAVTHDAQSFLIESLLWNTPSHCYGNETYVKDLIDIFAHLKEQLSSDSLVSDWGEVNELKYLFRDSQKWTRQGALAFVKNADNYLADL